MQETVLINSMAEENPQIIEVTQTLPWLTPGMYLAQKVFGSPLVRFVGERYEGDYLQIVVVLDDDPENLLEMIFDCEQKMYKKFDGLKLDVRVTVVPSKDSIDLIKQSSVVHIERD